MIVPWVLWDVYKFSKKLLGNISPYPTGLLICRRMTKDLKHELRTPTGGGSCSWNFEEWAVSNGSLHKLIFQLLPRYSLQVHYFLLIPFLSSSTGTNTSLHQCLVIFCCMHSPCATFSQYKKHQPTKPTNHHLGYRWNSVNASHFASHNSQITWR